VLQPNGKVIVGGDFVSYNATSRASLCRLNTDGTLDVSFNVGTGFDDYVKALALQSDGKLVVGGAFTTFNRAARNRIVRLNTNGTTDAAFRIGTGFNNLVNAVALQPDGKILVGGSFVRYKDTSLARRICRLNTDGSLDPTFNSPIDNGSVSTIALQPDGKVLVGGDFISCNGTPTIYICRLNADGTRDPSFNVSNGFENISLNGISSLVLQPDSKVLVGGRFATYNGVSRNLICRLNTDGSLDTSFAVGNGFYAALTLGGVYTLALQPDSKVLVGGNFSSYNGTVRPGVCRLNTDGSLDPSFEVINATGTAPNNQLVAFKLLLQPDGKVFVGGNSSTYNGVYRNRFARLFAYETPVAAKPIEKSDTDLYPNPAQGQVFLKADKSAFYKILSSTGSVLQSGSLAVGEALDISHLPTGVYPVILTFSQTVKVRRLVKE